MPVRPTTSTTSASKPSSSAIARPLLPQAAELVHEIVHHRLCLPAVDDRDARGGLAESGRDPELLLRGDVAVWHAFLLAQERHVREDLLRLDVLRHDHELGLAPLDELCDLVRPLADLSALAGAFDALVRLVREILRDLEPDVDGLRHWETSFSSTEPHDSSGSSRRATAQRWQRIKALRGRTRRYRSTPSSTRSTFGHLPSLDCGFPAVCPIGHKTCRNGLHRFAA